VDERRSTISSAVSDDDVPSAILSTTQHSVNAVRVHLENGISDDHVTTTTYDLPYHNHNANAGDSANTTTTIEEWIYHGVNDKTVLLPAF
jgi:microcystin-dependent protein